MNNEIISVDVSVLIRQLRSDNAKLKKLLRETAEERDKYRRSF